MKGEHFYVSVAIIASAAIAGFSSAAPPKDALAPTTTSPNNADRPVPHDLAVLAMRKVIKNAEFKAMPFEEFVEWLERTTSATVIVRWKLLNDAGVRRDQPVNLRLKNVPVRKIIQLVLDQLKRDDPAVRLAAKADDNTLILSTVRDLYRELVTRTYDVNDLLLTVPQFSGGRVGSPTGGPAKSLSLIRPHDGDKNQKMDEQTLRLVEMITSHIYPESWKVNGGEGTITLFNGRLIVRNNLLVHEQLGGGSPPSLQKP